MYDFWQIHNTSNTTNCFIILKCIVAYKYIYSIYFAFQEYEIDQKLGIKVRLVWLFFNHDCC